MFAQDAKLFIQMIVISRMKHRCAQIARTIYTNYIYYLKCTKEEWDQKNAEEKTERIEATIAEKIQKATDPNFLMLEKLTKIENHLSIVKGILVFFTVLSILGALILLINIS